MWYQTELLVRDRIERIAREAEAAQMGRLNAGRPRTPARPSRLRFLGRR